LTQEEKEELLQIARESIRCAVMGDTPADVTIRNPVLNEDRGAFVTISIEGNLRGCIGYIQPIGPLYEAVLDVAGAAAVIDPRFMPLSPEEYDNIEIEISVLSPLEQIEDVQQIEVGKHGILINKGGYKGVLLPQVATDNNWDRKTFLEQTCLKAHLPRDVWKDPDTVIQVFSAEVFSEDDI